MWSRHLCWLLPLVLGGRGCTPRLPERVASLDAPLPVTVPLDYVAFVNNGRISAEAGRIRGPAGQTLLHEAALLDLAPTIARLIRAGVPTDARNHDGQTPLHLAAAVNSVDATRTLLEFGAAVNPADNYQRRPLHFACMFGNTEAARLLLSAGAPAGLQDGWRWTPLHWAVSGGNLPLVRILLERGASPHVPDERGRTPVSLASRQTPLLKALMARGRSGGPGLTPRNPTRRRSD